MKKTITRSCMAVVDIEFAGAVDTITTCGLSPQDKPFKLYIPLCAAHRTLAAVKEIKVLAGNVIAEYCLDK